MNILYVGDVMAEPGQEVVERLLSKIKEEFAVDFTIAQVENVDESGKGPGRAEIERLRMAGVDFFSGGNHSLVGSGSAEVFGDKFVPVIRPANLIDAPGKGWKIVSTPIGNVLVASILGQTVGNRQPEIKNPLNAIDEILFETYDSNLIARIVNFHGDFSSEKRVFGYYLDGKVTAVIGDHWHIPTADAMILPDGTAYITDVGMCGTLHSSLGIKTGVIIERWKSGKSSKNEIEKEGPLQFNAVVIEVDEVTSLGKSITHIQRIVEPKK